MLIHNVNKDENENELSFTAIGGAPNKINRQQGKFIKSIDYLLRIFFRKYT
jgi:hypothetical protein